MKVVYIAHPISGDIKGNLESVRSIIRRINLTMPDVIPFAPYWIDCHALNDEIPEERARGFKNNTELFRRVFIDEVWLFGHTISKGMQHEIELAESLGIPVVPISDYIKQIYSDRIKLSI